MRPAERPRCSSVPFATMLFTVNISISEPGAGSDAAGVVTSARRDGDEWVLNGNKVWCSGAHHPDTTIAVLTRTGEDRYRGLTLILVPNDNPGVDMTKMDALVRRSLGTTTIFFTDARVPYDNVIGGEGEGWRCIGTHLEAVHASHLLYSGTPIGPYHLTHDEFFTDFPGEALARALFAESDVDLAVLHSLPNLGFTKGYLTRPETVAALRDRYPGRFLLYGTVDAPVVGTAIDQLTRQVEELRIDGLKVYPAFFYDQSSTGWRLDGRDFGVPLLEAARDLGIRNVAVHKALWVPPAPREAFRVEDVSVADAFPDMTFQIIHAGMSFLPETCDLLARYPNVYATLESTFSFVRTNPAVFADVLAALLRAGGADRLLFATGANLMHPAPAIAAFRDFQLPDDVQERGGTGPLTDDDRRRILGGNTLRLHGRDPATVTLRPPDAFDELRRAGDAQPWSGLRDARARG